MSATDGNTAAATAAKRRIAGVFDRSAATFDAVGVDFFTPVARRLVAHAGLTAGATVLDVGCGRGAVLFAALAAVGREGRVEGIDMSPRMVELTRADAAGRGHDNVRVTVGDAEEPQLQPGTVDAVLAGLSLHLLPDPAAALAGFHRLLAPGGVLAFSTFAGQDRAFDAAMAAIAEFVPGDGVEPGRPQGPFATPGAIEELLGACRYDRVEIAEAEFESRFIDADHWLAWAWSHGDRVTLERVPDSDLLAASEAAKAAFQQARTPKGDYAIRTTVRFTAARPTR